MNYYTVQQVAEMARPNEVNRVWQEGQYIVVELRGQFCDRECDQCKPNPGEKVGSHTGASTRPRIKIRRF